MGHHHHHHRHRHSHHSSSAPSTGSPLGGIDFASALKNMNFPSLASSLIGNMDIGQLLGVLTGITSSPLKNTVSPQQFASPILKKEPTPPAEEKAQEIHIEDDYDEDSDTSEFETSSEAETPKAEGIPASEISQSLKFDPEKLSGMLNNLVNMLNTQPKP